MAERRLNVLFLCKGNSTLSIFAEAIVNRLGRGKFRGFSAGMDPQPEIDPLTIYQLERNNYDHQGLQVNDWKDYSVQEAPAIDFVISLSKVSPTQGQPHWPGEPMRTNWQIADPADAQGDEMQRKAAFVRALTELESRISIFVNLPIASLDRLKLQQRLDEIGNRESSQ